MDAFPLNVHQVQWRIMRSEHPRTTTREAYPFVSASRVVVRGCSFLCLESDLLPGWIYAVVLDGQGCYGLVDGVNLLTHVLRKIIDGFQVVLVISLENFHFSLDCFKFGSQGRNASIIFMLI